MNMDTLESDKIMGEPIAGAINARWSDNDTIVGTADSAMEFLADRTGNIIFIDELQEEIFHLVEKKGNNIYYARQNDRGTLRKLDLTTKENIELLERVQRVIPSPDGKQLLIVQFQVNPLRESLLVYDLESGEKISIVEGAEVSSLSALSWSPDQRMIAYNLKEDVNNTSLRSLYIYDILTGESSQIAVDVHNLSTSWSPSGEKMACTEFGARVNSSIIYLNLQK